MTVRPSLTAVKTDPIEPPYPQEIIANGWHPELHIDRIIASDTWVLAEDDEKPWLLRIWFEAWRSVPAGSMPGDRKLFARRIGCKEAFLAAHSESLLRGWQIATDGRLYHSFITMQVTAMVERRRAVSKKVKDWRERKKAEEAQACNRLQADYQPVSNQQEQEQEQEQEQDINTATQAQPAANKARRGSRLQVSEAIPQDYSDFARKERPELDPQKVYLAFCDYWVAKPGQSGVKLDWLATWRNWVRNHNGGNRNGNAPNSSASKSDRRGEYLNELARRAGLSEQ